MRIRRQTEEPVEVQMAPLIDIVFLLLIFFLVATTLKKVEEELPIELPVSGAAIEKAQEADLLILAVDAEGRKYIGSEPVTTATLHDRLAAAAEQNPGQEVRLDADRATRYEDLIEVIELCQFHNLRNVGLHTRKTNP